MYMPNKPTKYGIKLYILANPETWFAWNIEVYYGKNDNVDNSGAAVVIWLLDSLQGKGHTVYTDRFYMSISLADQLEALNNGIVGTVTKNKKGGPEWNENCQSEDKRPN